MLSLGIALTQLQHLSFSIVKLWDIPMGPLLELVQVPLDAILSFSKIKQLPSEPFVMFVERLTRAVELQLSPVCAAVGEAIILHYMDDVLLCAPNYDLLSQVLDPTIDSLVAAGFELQEEKIQRMPPWKYVGLEIDASGTSHKSVITWKNPQTQQWEKDIVEVEGSPQVAELAAVVRTFGKFPEPFNLVTDSAYVAGVVSRAELAVLSEVSNSALFNLLSKLVNLISHQEQQFYVMHIRSHTDLPGFIAEGNRRADALVAPVEMAPLPDIFGQAKISHQLFHQNVPGLVCQFHLTQEQAQAIVSMCPSCQQHALPALSAGANPRGLKSCEVWQTDVTHIMSFGRQRETRQLQLKAKPPVMVKEPATKETEGPHDLITWGRGYACVSTPSGPKERLDLKPTYGSCSSQLPVFLDQRTRKVSLLSPLALLAAQVEEGYLREWQGKKAHRS
ncbi:hypothetical protein DUI87_10775 [Hirundo rustica rustica]|uniref:Uncharacterized protein n=1 Tax=Hirundo rustica rustica TaxID=333673 RepID=A0A3M0KKR8_HIRRU|nr:hypothetical protein DUI87_10775 [Hirundo rustica rustica]